jgi:hypothetical protein
MTYLQAHAAVSFALACVLWTVQLVIYPAFPFIDPRLFQSWHNRYTGAITWVVAPLILLQTAGVAARLLARNAGAQGLGVAHVQRIEVETPMVDLFKASARQIAGEDAVALV